LLFFADAQILEEWFTLGKSTGRCSLPKVEEKFFLALKFFFEYLEGSFLRSDLFKRIYILGLYKLISNTNQKYIFLPKIASLSLPFSQKIFILYFKSSISMGSIGNFISAFKTH